MARLCAQLNRFLVFLSLNKTSVTGLRLVNSNHLCVLFDLDEQACSPKMFSRNKKNSKDTRVVVKCGSGRFAELLMDIKMS